MRKIARLVIIVLLFAGLGAVLQAAPGQGQTTREIKQHQREQWQDLKRQQRDERKSFSQQRHTREERKLFKQELQREKALLRSGQKDENKSIKDNREFAKRHPQP